MISDDDVVPGQRLYPFHGGLKLRHHKQIACRHPIRRPPLPERLYIPLRQHQGPANTPLVGSGDAVLKGQVIADIPLRGEPLRGEPLRGEPPHGEPLHDLPMHGVPLHAPTSGRVLGVQDWPVAWPPGVQAPCLVLEPDGAERWCDPRALPDWENAEPDRIAAHLADHGLSGLGGAMFPTAAKLRGLWPEIHTVILNGAECEPWIACDEMLMRERPDDIVRGGLVLARAAGARHVVIAIEDQMGTVADALRRAVEQADPDGRVRVVKVTTIYPEGGERQLIQVLTGREVPHDGLPQDLGLVCLNVATARAAAAAVIDGRPLIERVVTVTGPGIADPCNLLALIGTPVSHLVAAAGGYQGEIDRLVLGGPMSGLPLSGDRVPVTKGSNCVLALTPADTARAQPQMPCINCGECVRVCPAQLLPQLLYRHIEGDDLDEAESLNLWDCIECGCCAQVCPSHIPLVDYYRYGKGALAERGREAARARQARERYEAREARLAEEQTARRARRQAREQALKQGDDAQAEVAAAIARAKARRQRDGDAE